MIPMPHAATVYRPAIDTDTTAQTIGGYSVLYRNVPCFIQPADSKEAFYYEQRGIENTHTVYTSRTDLTIHRNDVLERDGQQYHVVGVKNGLERDVYLEIACVQYPEGAKLRLDRGEYP